jgi:phage shock protein A
MKSILAVVGVCAIVLVGGYFLLGPRGPVLRDKFSKNLDKLIGPKQIEMQKIKEGLADLDRVLDQVDDRLAHKVVPRDRLAKEVKDSQTKITEYEAYGAEVLGAVEMAKKSPGTLITLRGEQYSSEDLNRLAGKVAENLKTARMLLDKDKARLAELEEAVKTWQDRRDSLAAKKKKFEERRDLIQSNIKDAEVLQKDAKVMSGDADKGLEDRLKDLDKRLTQLDEDAEVQRLLADKKWKDVTAQVEKDKKGPDLTIPPTGKSGADALAELLGTKPAGKDK